MSFSGLFPIPGLMGADETIQRLALDLHGWLNWLLSVSIFRPVMAILL